MGMQCAVRPGSALAAITCAARPNTSAALAVKLRALAGSTFRPNLQRIQVQKDGAVQRTRVRPVHSQRQGAAAAAGQAFPDAEILIRPDRASLPWRIPPMTFAGWPTWLGSS